MVVVSNEPPTLLSAPNLEDAGGGGCRRRPGRKILTLQRDVRGVALTVRDRQQALATGCVYSVKVQLALLALRMLLRSSVSLCIPS